MHIPPRSLGSLKAIASQSYLARQVLLPVQQFIHTEGLSGFALFAATVAALVWANSPWQQSYEALWHTYFTVDFGFFYVSESLLHWINDGLMALFFFVVGLEIKREVLHGELRDRQRAALPVLAGLGGMLAPALLYTVFNTSGDSAAGWGIPMATDIAFALGVLTLLGRRVPVELRIFLLAFAIVDDLGAILVIAVFYTEQISWSALGLAGVFVGVLWAFNRAGVKQPLFYLLLGILLWETVLESGVHATVAGVVTALFVPSTSYFTRDTFIRSLEILVRQLREAVDLGQKNRSEAIMGRIELLSRDSETPLERLERVLHPWTGYLVLPLFALANAGIPLSAAAIQAALGSPVAWGILAGLLLGKPLGIFAFSWLAVRLKWAALPKGASWTMILGVGVLAGIGFTVSLFIAGLSFGNIELSEKAKLSILLASLLAGLAGSALLLWSGRKRKANGAQVSDD